MGSERINLKALLKENFNLNLDIVGGFGDSVQNSIVILASDPHESAIVEMLVLRGICKLRGVLWRTLERKYVLSSVKCVHQVKVETREITQDRVITQRENYYFDVMAADPTCTGLPPIKSFLTPDNKFSMPYELSWLHFDGAKHNEPLAPGLGYSLAYGAPGIKGTVFIYTCGATGIQALDCDAVRTEFMATCGDVLKAHPNAELIGRAGEGGLAFRQDFRIGKGRSLVSITKKDEYFVKLRITTIEDDPVFFDVVEDAIAALRVQMGPN